MTKIDNFKEFVKKNSNLITYVKQRNKSWQKFYEIYNLYREESDIWKEYILKEEKIDKAKSITVPKSSNNTLSNIVEMAKNIDTNKLQDGISSIQKAISLFGDMLIKDSQETNTYTPRPISRKFDD